MKCGRVIYQFPGIEVHGRQFSVVGLGNVNIQRLALINEGATIGRHLNYITLRNFPHRFIQGFNVVRNAFDVLDGSKNPKKKNQKQKPKTTK